MRLEELLELEAEPLDKSMLQAVQNKWDMVAKPLNGLGRFEEIFDRIGAINGSTSFRIDNKAIIAMCADNGIVEEGVSQSGQEVTFTVASFMGRNQSSVGKMASVAGVDIIPIDIGINCEEEIPGVRNCKVAMGTKNFLKEAAMTAEEALKAIETGIELVRECKEKGYHILGTGEMGIGNTTTSSAIVAAILQCEVAEATGRGAGLDDEGLRRKIAVITQGIDKFESFCELSEKKTAKYGERIENPGDDTRGYEDRRRSFEILCRLGGLDIAGLVGVFIGGALYKVPIVLDGIISSVAALVAEEIVPGVRGYMIASHVSREPAANRIMERLELTPVIYGDLALGEGTGAVMMFSLLDVAFSLYESETTFDEMQIEKYERYV